MSNSETVRQKRTANNEPERTYHAVPWPWAFLGRHQSVRPGQTRFYAEAICHQHRLESESTGRNTVSYTERDDLYVLYRNPETGECVERHYDAATLESETPVVSVAYPNPAGTGEPGDYTRINYPALEGHRDGLVVVPKTVFDGEPQNFRASIAVSPDETRVESGVQ